MIVPFNEEKNMTVKISILDGHHQPQTRQTKTGTRYFQTAYAQLGGVYPVEIEVPLRGPSDAHAVGDYAIAQSSFRVGKFRNLELNPFELTLVSVAKTTVRAAS